jgi:hypothetical protein
VDQLHDNVVRIHTSARITPAMAPKVTERLWDIGDMVKWAGSSLPRAGQGAVIRLRGAINQTAWGNPQGGSVFMAPAATLADFDESPRCARHLDQPRENNR